MAGLGFRTFVSGEVLTAANVNGYLMEQAVMVFASASARTTALPTPSEGMVSYLTDTNATQFYDGAAWVSLIPNSLVTAKADLVTATGSGAPARLGVGSNDTLLVADSATSTGLKWATLTASQIPTLSSAKVPTLDIVAQTGNYTLALSDAGDLVEMGSASAITLTVPADASVAFPTGTKIDILQTGAGQVTIAGAGGVTVNATPGLKISARWGAATLIKRASNTWVLVGSLTA